MRGDTYAWTYCTKRGISAGNLQARRLTKRCFFCAASTTRPGGPRHIFWNCEDRLAQETKSGNPTQGPSPETPGLYCCPISRQSVATDPGDTRAIPKATSGIAKAPAKPALRGTGARIPIHRAWTTGVPPPPAVPDAATRASPVLRLKNGEHLSRVNHDCWEFLELLTTLKTERLELDMLAPGLRWALMKLPTGPTSSDVWSIYVKYSPTSIFSDNTLSMQHALIRGAHVNLPGPNEPPSIRLGSRPFKLHQTETSPEGNPSGPLFLQLPLEDGFSSEPELGRITFLPPGHGLLYLSMNRANGFTMLRNAGMTTHDMEHFLEHHGDHSTEFPRWLLGDLMGVVHHSHLPFELSREPRDADWSSDEDDPAPPLGDRMMYASTLYHDAPLLRIWATFPDMYELVVVHGQDAFTNIPKPPEPWWVRTKGFLDDTATRPFISRSFARKPNLNFEALDTNVAGPIIELGTRPSYGWNQLSNRRHRAQHYGIGQVSIAVDFSTDPNQPHRGVVPFVVFEDSTLPRGSSVDFVQHSAFTRQSPAWVEAAVLNDQIAQGYRQGLSAPSYCDLPRTCNRPAAAAPGPQARVIPARDLAMQHLRWPASKTIATTPSEKPWPQPTPAVQQLEHFWPYDMGKLSPGTDNPPCGPGNEGCSATPPGTHKDAPTQYNESILTGCNHVV